MIMCAKTRQKQVMKASEGLGEFSGILEAMRVDSDAEIYHKQYDLDYRVKSVGESTKADDRLKLNLYFDSIRRSRELLQMDIALDQQKDYLNQLLKSGGIPEDHNRVRRENSYYKIIYDQATGALKSFERDERKVARDSKLSGFFSIMTHKLDFDAMRTYRSYRLCDEQEKCFQMMKEQMVSDRQQNWSEDGQTGRLFILFVSLILGSHVRHVWSSTNLRGLFSSSQEVLDEMRSIRCIEHTNRAKVITPFVGSQVAICEAFGFPIPKDCTLTYISRQKPKRKWGLPPERKIETSSM
jgi:hypothetical protein